MNCRNKLSQVLLHLFAVGLAASPQALLGQAPDNEADPWFEEQLNREHDQADEDSDSSAVLRKRSPRALYNALMTDFNKLPENALTQRIDLLEEAARIAPDESEEAQSTLAELKSLKAKAILALDEAAKTDALPDAIAALKPFARYFAADTDLRARLASSPLVARLESDSRELASAGSIDELNALQRTLDDSGLSRLLGERASLAHQGGLAELVESKWLAALAQSQPLPGERFLLSRLLRGDDEKLRVQLALPSEISPAAASQLNENIRRLWGKDLAIGQAQAGAHSPDLVLRIELDDFNVSRSESASTVRSEVPGKVTEEPNPEFMNAVSKYKKAVESYEVALKTYEAQYKNYIDGIANSDASRAQQGAKNAQASYEAAFQAAQNGGAANPGADPNVVAAGQDLKLAEALSASMSEPYIPEPIKPYPFHLKILETIYTTPSTIVIAESSEPYEYTSQTLKYLFAAEAQLALAAPSAAAPAASSSLSLSRERSWTKNVGVNQRDPSADEGNFNEEELASAKNLFNLEFGSACAKKLDELFSAATASLEKTGVQEGDLEALVLSLSLRARDDASSALALSEADLRALAELARDPAVTPERFRRECLAKAIGRSPLAAKLSQPQLDALL